MKELKKEKTEFSLNRYWKIFIPLAIFLLISLQFPIRIGGQHTFYSMMFYSAFLLGSLRIAYRFYQSYHWQFRRLLLLMILCVGLASWQVIDLGILRVGEGQGSFAEYLGSVYSVPDNVGDFWFQPRFKNESIMCHNIYERYLGNEFIAIRIEVKDTPWPVCGG